MEWDLNLRLDLEEMGILVGAYGWVWSRREDLVWMKGANRPRSASPWKIFLMRWTGRRYGNWGHNKPSKATPPANLPRNPRTPQTPFYRGHKQDQPQEPGKKSLCSKACQPRIYPLHLVQIKCYFSSKLYFWIYSWNLCNCRLQRL